jgi:hypothetical protein
VDNLEDYPILRALLNEESPVSSEEEHGGLEIGAGFDIEDL